MAAQLTFRPAAEYEPGTARRFARVRVTTSEHPFFLPARRMYEKCGFRVFGITTATDASPYGIVHYEKLLIA